MLAGFFTSAVERAKSLWVQAERQIEEILRDMPKATGGDAQRTRFDCVTESKMTLAEIGIDKRTSSRAQKLAALPEKTFAAVASGDMPVAKAIAKLSRNLRSSRREPQGQPCWWKFHV